MKNLIISMTLCFLVAVYFGVPTTLSYAQDTSDEKGPDAQEEFNRLLNELIDRGIEPEAARQKVGKLLENRKARRLERQLLEAERNKPITFTNPADIAFKKAMDKDLSRGVGEGRTQMGAVHAWEELIKRDDISEHQRRYALWRMASLLAYNFDPERGEAPNFDRSKKLFKKVMYLTPGLLCNETINSATQYATQPGTALEKAERLAESYRFLKTATQKMYSESSGKINRNGYALDKKFFSGIARLPAISLEETTKRLNRRMDDGQGVMKTRITGFLEYCTDEVASKRLLKLLEEFADPKDMEKWRNIKSKFQSWWATNEAALQTLA